MYTSGINEDNGFIVLSSKTLANDSKPIIEYSIKHTKGYISIRDLINEQQKIDAELEKVEPDLPFEVLINNNQPLPKSLKTPELIVRLLVERKSQIKSEIDKRKEQEREQHEQQVKECFTNGNGVLAGYIYRKCPELIKESDKFLCHFVSTGILINLMLFLQGELIVTIATLQHHKNFLYLYHQYRK
jgi:succinate dehydrogenase/fumarate reductase-like Fe-S protein